MKASYIIIGLLLLLFAYAVSLITVPWIKWVGDIFPTPQYAPISLLPVAYIFGCIGVIAIIFGLTANDVIRIFFSFLTIMACLALLTGFISLEKILEWGKI
jgi:uncharacterized membrane protein YphA (DoxX/SURF4 family)